jgi:hypothetical protein
MLSANYKSVTISHPPGSLYSVGMAVNPALPAVRGISNCPLFQSSCPFPRLLKSVLPPIDPNLSISNRQFARLEIALNSMKIKTKCKF